MIQIKYQLIDLVNLLCYWWAINGNTLFDICVKQFEPIRIKQEASDRNKKMDFPLKVLTSNSVMLNWHCHERNKRC